jgi:hypothetical protein
VLDELQAHVVPGVDAVLGKGVEPQPCIVVHLSNSYTSS